MKPDVQNAARKLVDLTHDDLQQDDHLATMLVALGYRPSTFHSCWDELKAEVKRLDAKASVSA